ncbi:hypothetical protein Q8A73_001160 [Channa argus]|nr:hypothetical protein Q8A73_001160 [Channa argus]
MQNPRRQFLIELTPRPAKERRAEGSEEKRRYSSDAAAGGRMAPEHTEPGAFVGQGAVKESLSGIGREEKLQQRLQRRGFKGKWQQHDEHRRHRCMGGCGVGLLSGVWRRVS